MWTFSPQFLASSTTWVQLWSVCNSSLGPYAYGTAIYVFLQNAAGTQVSAWKSVDNGATWAEFAGPAVTPSSFTDFDPAAHYCTATDGAKLVYLAAWTGTHADTLRLAKFDMSTDQWTTYPNGPQIYAASGFDCPFALHFRPSDGKLVIVYWGDTTTVNVKAAFFWTWTPGVNITAAPTEVLRGVECRTCLSTDGANYWVNVFMQDRGDGAINVYQRSIKGDGSLGTLQTLGAVATAPLAINGQAQGIGLDGPQYSSVGGIPHAQGSDILFPYWINVSVGFTGTAYIGHKVVMLRGDAGNDPVWSTQLLNETYSTTPVAFGVTPVAYTVLGPIQSGVAQYMCAYADPAGTPGLFIIVTADVITSATWDGAAWTDAAQVAVSDPANSIYFWRGSTLPTFFSTRNILGALDAVVGMGFEQLIDPGLERAAQSLVIIPAPVPPSGTAPLKITLRGIKRTRKPVECQPEEGPCIPEFKRPKIDRVW